MEEFPEKYISFLPLGWRIEARKALESVLLAAERRGEVKGMREAAKLIESQFWKADQECDACGHIPEKDVAYFIKQKADSLEKEAT